MSLIAAVSLRLLGGVGLAPLALTAALALASDVRAQERRPIRATDLYRIRTASDVAVSPNGQHIAFVVTQIDSVDNAYYSHIWVADAEDSRPRQYTQGKVRDANPVWSPDGRKIAFVSNRSGEQPEIHVLPTDGGEAWQLTELQHGAWDPVWSPDGQALLFTSTLTTRELEEEAAERDTAATGETAAAADTAMWGSLAAIRNWLAKRALEGEPAVITRLNFQDERELRPIEAWSQIYVVDLAEKEPRRLTDGPYDFGDPDFAPDGHRIAFVATITDGIHPDYSLKSDLYIADLYGGSQQKLDIPGYAIFNPAWSPDGSRIAFTARDTAERSSANVEIGVIELADGEVVGEVDWLSQPLDRSVRQFRWAPDGRSVYLAASVHGTVPVYRVRIDNREIRQMVSGERGVLSFDLSGRTLAYAVTEPANPSEVYVVEAAGNSERCLTALNSGWLSDVQVQPHRGFWFHSFDGKRVQGWLIEPVGYRSEVLYPLVLEIHGGPHAMWGPGEATMWHEFQFLASNGYFVLYTNPRGSDGYGHGFKHAIQRAWGEGPMGDVLTAVDSVVARGSVDPERLVVTGGSYAGYLTAYIVGHDHRFRAAVAQRGVYDLAVFFGEGNAWRLVPQEFNTYPWEDTELLRTESPITFAHQIETPLLIMHADRDLRTGVSQSEMLYRTLKVLRKPVEYVRYPREGHDLSRTGEPLLRVDRLLRILEFFERHLRSGA